MRPILSFCSVLAFGAMTSAALVALLPWFSGHAPEGLQIGGERPAVQFIAAGLGPRPDARNAWSIELGRRPTPGRDVVPRARAAILLLFADRALRRRAALLLRRLRPNFFLRQGRARPGHPEQLARCSIVLPWMAASGGGHDVRKRGGLGGPPLQFVNEPTLSDGIVHVVLDRVRGHLVAHVLFHAQRDVGVDHVVVHDTARFHEVAVFVEAVESLAK